MSNMTVKVPVIGTTKYNVLVGTDLSDTISGGQGTDLIYGGTGSDHLYGGSGKDVLYGGTGQDFLYGGSGADTFVYTKAADAGMGKMADRIGDFHSGIDHLDLSAFMAGGHFIGADAFTAGTGPSVRYTQATGLLQGDVNGDGIVDFAIVLTNHSALVEADINF
ncbi:MAG: M10 family metallopeptidase C-terminal domain-containing protein [Cypionkella sp.]